ncbi:uncharacterized protein UTRI_06341 [Ustilago trichophora]|uniref:Uncharacterized protein n=1 Tax=Ustilago trichophora TaxID=86804 RepID=A0A5C3ELL2_9BASI|nr:uncharacterized protein UTRI_06341 [Ustilago trichophora]
MPDLRDRSRPSTLAHSSITKLVSAHPSQSAACHLAGVHQHHVASSSFTKATPLHRTTITPINTTNLTNHQSVTAQSLVPTATRPLHHQNHARDAVYCIKPLPSVPKDVDADEGLDNDGSELVHHSHPSNYIESDISSASASSSSSSTTSSSMETDWHETSIRNQVAKLHIQYTDVDLAQTEAPSVFGLRRRIVAAALDQISQRREDVIEGGPSELRQLDERGLSEWLAVPAPSGQWKEKILRKKISFGKKQAKALAGQNSVHDPMPNGAASPSDSIGRSRASSSAGSTSSHDRMLKRDKELADREANFDLVVLSRFETAELKMIIYTEHRQGNWVVKGPAEPGSNVLEEPPLVYSPWDCQIDSRAIVERKKLRSFIELSDTTCAVRCSTCSSPHHQRLGQGYEAHRKNIINRHGDGVVGCKHCQGSGAVKATYVVCVTLRQSTFLPLTMPARHRAGKHQNAFRAYLPKTTKAMSHVDVLRMRSLEAVRSCALRVGRAHHKEHDARLLMAKATLERRSCNSVAVINKGNGVFRTFDITDGGCVRGHAGAGLTEEQSRIIESGELAYALSNLPVTAVVQPEGTYRFIDLELVDMATSKHLSFMMEESRSASIYTSGGSSTDDSYSPSAFSFFQRAAGHQQRVGGNSSRDSHTLRGNSSRDAPRHPSYSSSTSSSYRITGGDEPETIVPSCSDSKSRWQLPPLNITPTSAASLSSCSPSSSLLSFTSARNSPTTSASGLSAPRKPWTRNGSTPGSPALTTSSLSGLSMASYDTAHGGASKGSTSSHSSGTIPAKTRV